jgi:hypothetical protein
MIYTLIFATLLFPLKGALIRWRANFTPKIGPVPELPLIDVQQTSQPRSLLGMLRRVNAEEVCANLHGGVWTLTMIPPPSLLLRELMGYTKEFVSFSSIHSFKTSNHLHNTVPTLAFTLFREQTIPLPSMALIGYLHFGEYDQSAVFIIAIASLIKIIATVIEAVFVNRCVLLGTRSFPWVEKASKGCDNSGRHPFIFHRTSA